MARRLVPVLLALAVLAAPASGAPRYRCYGMDDREGSIDPRTDLTAVEVVSSERELFAVVQVADSGVAVEVLDRFYRVSFTMPKWTGSDVGIEVVQRAGDWFARLTVGGSDVDGDFPVRAEGSRFRVDVPLRVIHHMQEPAGTPIRDVRAYAKSGNNLYALTEDDARARC